MPRRKSQGSRPKPKPEKQVIRLCYDCAKKIEKLYYLDLIAGSEAAGECPQCWTHTTIYKFDLEPRRPYWKKTRGTGGGERARAERD